MIFVEINELGIASIIIEEHTNIIIFLKVYSLLFLNKYFMHALLSLFLFRWTYIRYFNCRVRLFRPNICIALLWFLFCIFLFFYFHVLFWLCACLFYFFVFFLNFLFVCYCSCFFSFFANRISKIISKNKMVCIFLHWNKFACSDNCWYVLILIFFSNIYYYLTY